MDTDTAKDTGTDLGKDKDMDTELGTGKDEDWAVAADPASLVDPTHSPIGVWERHLLRNGKCRPLHQVSKSSSLQLRQYYPKKIQKTGTERGSFFSSCIQKYMVL